MKYIIFDVDGTLLNSDASIVRCLKESSRKYGYEISYIRENIGVKKLEDILRLNKIDEKMIPLIIDDYKRCYEETFHIDTTPVDGSYEVLKDLHENSLGIVTFKYYKLTKILLDRFFPGINFNHIYCGDFPFKMTDKSEALSIIAENSGNPEIVYYVGDRKEDMDAAARAGVKRIWASFGLGSLDEGITYDYKINNFRELLDILR